MTTRPRGGCCSRPSEPLPLIDGSKLSSKNHLILKSRQVAGTRNAPLPAQMVTIMHPTSLEITRNGVFAMKMEDIGQGGHGWRGGQPVSAHVPLP